MTDKASEAKKSWGEGSELWDHLEDTCVLEAVHHQEHHERVRALEAEVARLKATPYWSQITGLQKAYNEQKALAERAEAERDAVKARLAEAELLLSKALQEMAILRGWNIEDESRVGLGKEMRVFLFDPAGYCRAHAAGPHVGHHSLSRGPDGRDSGGPTHELRQKSENPDGSDREVFAAAANSVGVAPCPHEEHAHLTHCPYFAASKVEPRRGRAEDTEGGP